MPFTVSHAAAVLPLKNTRLPLAALMIGSMSPDFAYFLPYPLSLTSTHNLRGIFLFCLPVGLIAWIGFVRFLERPTIACLPGAWRMRVARSDPRLSRQTLVFAALAVAIGAATHVVWDAFTHANTPVTLAIPALRAEVFVIAGHPIRMYFILQCLSSVVGLVALAVWAMNLRRRAPRARDDASGDELSDRARLVALAALLSTSGITALLSYAMTSGSHVDYRIFRFLIGGMTGALLAWCVIAAGINRARRSGAMTPLPGSGGDQTL